MDVCRRALSIEGTLKAKNAAVLQLRHRLLSGLPARTLPVGMTLSPGGTRQGVGDSGTSTARPSAASPSTAQSTSSSSPLRGASPVLTSVTEPVPRALAHASSDEERAGVREGDREEGSTKEQQAAHVADGPGRRLDQACRTEEAAKGKDGGQSKGATHAHQFNALSVHRAHTGAGGSCSGAAGGGATSGQTAYIAPIHARPTAETASPSLSHRLSSLVHRARVSFGGGSVAGNEGLGLQGVSDGANGLDVARRPAASAAQWIKKQDSSAPAAGGVSTSSVGARGLGSTARESAGDIGAGHLDEVVASVGPLSRAMEEGVYLMTSELEDVRLLRADLGHQLGLLLSPLSSLLSPLP